MAAKLGALYRADVSASCKHAVCTHACAQHVMQAISVHVVVAKVRYASLHCSRQHNTACVTYTA